MKTKGVLAVLIASVAYGIMPALTRTVQLMGLNAESIVFYRFLLSFVFSVAAVAIQGFGGVTKRQLLHLFVFGVSGCGLTIQLLTKSYQYIPTGLATMFHFAYPLFVILLLTLFFRERLHIYQIIACVVALAGIGAMADFNAGVNMTGSLLALLSAVSYGVFVIAGRKSSFVTLNPLAVILFISFFSSAVFGTSAAVQGKLMLPPTLAAWGVLMVIGLFCTVLALAMLTIGIRLLGPTTASMLNMLEPVTSVVTGLVVFHEVLTPRTAFGCILILCSAFIIVLGEKKPAQQKN